MVTASVAPTARTLEVPGARLYHEVRGKGPLLLLVGAPMDAGVDKQWNGQWRYGAVGRCINAAGRSDAGGCHRAEPSNGLTTVGDPMVTGSYVAAYAG